MHPIPFNIIRDAVLEILVEDTDGSDGDGDATYASTTALLHIIVTNMTNISCPADDDVDRGDIPRRRHTSRVCPKNCHHRH